MEIDLVDLKLSAQRGLLGNVSPRLRAVCVKAETNKVYATFYYDGEISEEDQELTEHTIDQIIADFISIKDMPEYYMPTIRIDYPEKMPLIGHWVYHRSEP